MNPNNLLSGDTIEVQQAWEDVMGNYHDEFPTITAIEPDGRLILDWGRPELNEFLEGADYFAADHERAWEPSNAQLALSSNDS